MSGVSSSRTDIAAAIRSSIGSRMAAGATWYPVSSVWFKLFEAYTATNESDAPHPGQVDNSDIQDSETAISLKKGITEKKDFVWVSSDGWTELIKQFKGGPAFPRVVEEDSIGMLKVSMYPQPCKLCVCRLSTRGAPQKDETTKKIQHVAFLVQRNLSVDKLLETAKQQASGASMIRSADSKLDISYFRLWAREQEEQVLAKDAPSVDPAEDDDEPAKEEAASATDAEQEGEHSLAEKAADATPAVVRGAPRPWRLLPRTDTTMEEIAGNDARTELMLELFDTRALWPRGTAVQPGQCGVSAWDSSTWNESTFRSELKVGSRVDAMDVDGVWLEAEVVGVTPQDQIDAVVRRSPVDGTQRRNMQNGRTRADPEQLEEHCGGRGPGALDGLQNGGDLLRVHFRAWGRNFDEYYLRSSWRTQPPWSRIRNFRDFTVGNRLVYMQASYNGSRQWYDGKVAAVDVDKKEIQIEAMQSGEKHTFPFDSPDITHVGVHTDKDKKLAIATPTGVKEATQYKAPGTNLYASSIYSVSSSANSTAMTSYGTSSYPSSSYTSRTYGGGGGWRSSREGTPDEAGAVGLMNLGNTCFMNSMLQCLSNTEPLTRYFLDNLYEDEINVDNFLGHGGKLAYAYADFLKEVWSGRFTVVAPQKLKLQISEKAPQFRGYQQHDSQELMNFLLDGLHEDLNRVREKPATEKVESDGRPDSVIGAIAWETYQERNNSVVADTFGGQLRSHVKCNQPGCGKVSITFDPFLSVSVPIPASKPRDIQFTFVPYTGPMLRLKCSLPSDGSFMNLRDMLVQLEQWHPCDSKAPDLSTGELQWAKVSAFGNRFVDLCFDTTPLADIRPNDWIFAYYVPRDAASPHANRAYARTPSVVDAEKTENGGTDGKPEEAGTGDSASKPGAGSADDLTPGVLTRSKSGADPDESGGADGSTDQLLALHHLLLPVNMFQPGILATSKVVSYGHPDVLSRPVVASLPTETPAPAVKVYKTAPGKLAGNSAAAAGGSGSGAKEEEELEPEGEVPGVTCKQVCAEIYRKLMPKYIFNPSGLTALEEEHELNPLNPPFQVVMAPVEDNYAPSASERTVLDPSSEDPVVLQPGYVLRVEWDPSKTGGKLDWLAESKRSTDKGAMDAVRHEDSFRAAARKEEKKLDIQDCFDAYTVREQLGASDTWYCPRCKEHRQAYKKFDIWTVPEVLVMHLKRFKYTVYSSTYSASAYRDKLSNLVDFPIDELDLTPYVKGPQPGPHIYELYAVSEHSGGLGGGHYTAVGRNFRNGKWYDFNDSSVHPTDAKSGVSNRAYVLFYRRKDRVRMRPLLPADVQPDGKVTKEAFLRLRGSASLYGRSTSAGAGDDVDDGTSAGAGGEAGTSEAGGLEGAAAAAKGGGGDNGKAAGAEDGDDQADV